MTKRRFDTLIFDWDGTLFDSVDWIVECLQGAALDSGLPEPPEEKSRSVIGLGLGEALEALFPGQPESRLRALMECYRRRYFTKQAGPADLFDGVAETLARLRADGFTLAIATGKSRRGLERALRGTGIKHLFSATRCADETASKPHPAMVYEIVAALGKEKTSALMIGDTTHDLEMAANAGICGIGVTCGAHSMALLAALAPLACLPTIRELPYFLFEAEHAPPNTLAQLNRDE